MDTSASSSGALAAPATPKTEGLRGVHVGDSAISLVDGDNGRLLYRGYDIIELAQHSTFEECAYVLLKGEMPDRKQLRAFSQALAAERKVPQPVLKLLKSLPKETSAMDALRTAVSLRGALDPDAALTTPEAYERVAIRIIGNTATLVAAVGRIQQGQPIVAPRRSGSHAENFYRMLTGREPDEFAERAMDVALILHADHEFNASTFSARVTVSTLSDLYSAITSAIGTLKGPLHGGANLAVMRQLEAIGSVGNVDAWVADTLGNHRKIMGFGHAVYRTMDPRATVLKKFSKDAGQRAGDLQWFEISDKLQEAVFRKKGLYPNVDFYSASTYRSLGIDPDLFPPIFAVSRAAGWCAHLLEQLSHNKLIRPLSNYTGPQLRPYPAKRSK